jgi:hypothetical protein
MKKLLISLTLLASGCAAVAHAQVPHIGSYSSMNGLPSSFALSGTSAGYTGWGKNGTGDMDFIAANNGSSPSFCWYFLLGSSTVTQEMCLNQSGFLVVPNGIIANLQGNVTGNTNGTHTGAVVGNVTGNVSGNATTATTTTGNAATASALDHTPTTCATYLVMYGITASGAPNCFLALLAKTTSVNTTGSPALSTASTVVPIQFNGTSFTMPDANYVASCSMVNATGFPYIYSIVKSTTSITVSYSNGTSAQAVASGAAEIDCPISGQ